jgi:hypothetical protein
MQTPAPFVVRAHTTLARSAPAPQSAVVEHARVQMRAEPSFPTHAKSVLAFSQSDWVVHVCPAWFTEPGTQTCVSSTTPRSLVITALESQKKPTAQSRTVEQRSTQTTSPSRY